MSGGTTLLMLPFKIPLMEIERVIHGDMVGVSGVLVPHSDQNEGLV